MSIFSDYLANIIIFLIINSFLVLIDNLIKTEGKDININNITIKEELYLSSIFISTIIIIIDTIFLILIKKEKIIIEILIILFLLLFLIKFKESRKIIFFINHIIFDITLIFKPFF
jgi:hypothetical protein